MAGGAGLDGIGMIEVGGNPAGRRMAVIAGIVTGDVLLVLARRHRTVMAGVAGSDSLSMVDSNHRYPGNVVVAILADVGCIDVGRRLAGRGNAVMATGAPVDDAIMVEIDRRPGDRRVAIVTVVAALDMLWMLAHGDDPVVTGAAGTDHLRVVYRDDRHPGAGAARRGHARRGCQRHLPVHR